MVQQPNFFGSLEEVDQLTDWAHANDMLVIAVVNPVALALLKPPGEWGGLIDGKRGADIVCGEGQPLGVPLASGGPYFGFMATRMQHVRQMPGRIVGRTADLEGRPGFSLTLQAREQHIRRSKATSNICTNQGLMVTAATIYMSLLGAEGLKRVAAASAQRTAALVQALTRIPGVAAAFDAPALPRGGAAPGPPRGAGGGRARRARDPGRTRPVHELSRTGERTAHLCHRNQTGRRHRRVRKRVGRGDAIVPRCARRGSRGSKWLNCTCASR